MDSVKVIASALDVELSDLLEEATPGLLTHVLPHFATGTSGSGDAQAAKKSRHAAVCYNLLAEDVGKEVSGKRVRFLVWNLRW